MNVFIFLNMDSMLAREIIYIIQHLSVAIFLSELLKVVEMGTCVLENIFLVDYKKYC